MLRDLPTIVDANVLVGNATSDDAAIYRLSDDVALVLTADFFTPIVDDPRAFGAIAAANAFSDVYAMGGRPIAALALAGFPDALPLDMLHDILAGGADKAREAGVAIVGGHTVKDPEPKYGLSVTGIVRPDAFVRNTPAGDGDLLVLTKPLGTGIITTARKADAIGDDGLSEAVASMMMLNRAASEAMLAARPSAATDITGFGLLGHLLELVGDGGADVDAAAVPLFDDVIDLALRGFVPGGSKNNLDSVQRRGVRFDASVPQPLRLALADAQTSGGLLVAVPEERADGFLRDLQKRGVNRAAVIGVARRRPGISVR